MGCVNRNGKEFKALAARNNVAINTLELFTHKYWLETGNETLFPSDVYIQAQLGNGHYLEKGKNVRALWKMQYNSPKEFASMGALQSAYKEASKYFPETAIVYYKNAKGNFMLSVKRPVEKADYTKDEFFDKFDNMGSMKDVKKFDLGIKEKRVYGIDKVQELYNKFNTDKTSQALADRAFNIAKELGLQITFDESLPFGIFGRYTNNNTLRFKKSFLEGDTMNSEKAPIMLHEVLHALSMYALSDQTKNWKRSENLEGFRTEMNSLYQDLKNNPLLKGERGILNLPEFVAELANPVFRSKIQQIDKETKAKKSFWSKVLDAFKKLLGLHTTNTYYQRSMNALEKALDAFDIDTYMRYNGIKKPLRDGYNAKEWEFNSMSDAEVKSNVKDYLDKQAAKERQVRLTDIKPEYKGKLIYAQSGTGKSTIADNVTVFDSDYLLGQLLGVSPETAGFFFGRLSASQKKVFGKQYRDAIKQKIAEGYTVVTANESLLPEADVVVYNSSAKQTDERVNREDRAINNRYHAINYHESTLSKIKELRDNDKENKKEYRELDNGHYLSDIISSDPSIFRNTSSDLYGNSKQKESNSRLREEVLADFLNEFGITVHTISNYDGELPLFDALNRVINAKEPSDITDGVGYAIAFMMQGDPEMQRMVVESHFGMKGDFDKRVPIINKKLKNLHPNQHSPIAKEVLKEVGTQIATELRNNFDSDIEDVKSDKSIWKVIKNFFKKLGMSIAAFGHRGSVQKSENLFVKDIIAALGREDYSRIRGPRIKEGTNELAQRIDVETALKENPYEDNIIRKLGEHGIALAGSTSIALQGSLFRPSENPLHDIDFSAGNNSSKESLDKLLPQIFPKGTIQFSHALKKDKNGDQTVTYITLSEPFEIRKTGFDTADLYSKDGRLLGKRKHYDLELADGVQGKMLDFFTGPTQESNHGFYNQTINGHNYLLSESNAAMAAKILWARPKDMWDYKYFKKNDFINSLSGKELKEELSLIKQESADYGIVNGIEEEHKHSGKAVPTVFMFADGTKVQAPFRPNAQQVDVLNAMDRFMKSHETSMTLSGYAGTGKTSLMELIAKKGQMQHRPVVFCASTNKAAAVLKNRVSKAGFDASTLNKIFGIQVEVDPNSKSYNAKNLVNKVKDPSEIDIIPGTTVIIDEASMINEENYNILNRIAEQKGLKIIYVGDEAQLAPVNEDKISKVFRNGEGKVIRLTQVERTDDNAILKEATDIRNGKPLSRESSFNSKGEGVAYISPEHQDAIDEVIEHYVKGLKQDPNYFRILAYTNKAVAAYNNQVRELLGYNTPIPQSGEPMTGYNNWGYDWRTKSYRFINSEAYKVIKTDAPITISTRLEDGTRVSMQAIPVTLEDSLGKMDTFNYMDIKSNPQNRQAAMTLANEKKRLFAKARQVVGRQAKAEIYAQINDLDKFLFVNDNIEDSRGNTLQAKTIDFGYAMTVHKSQGSTFTHVLMDDVDIARGSKGNDVSNAWSVDLGEESTNDPSTAQLKSTSDVDLGDLGNTEEESTTNNTVNKRQQLEYVGVSRATDTVTVISSSIKKEGSPLHPEKAIKEDKATPQQQARPTLAEQKLKQFRENGIFYSGGANGSDLAWARELESLGLKVKHYLVKDYDSLSQEEKDGIERVYKDVVKTLGRRELPANNYAGKLVRRDYLQVAGADAIYAIGTFDKSGNVSGGTAYAVEYARKIGGKPIYFYNLNTHQWYYAIDSNAFAPMNSLPHLTERAAVIGTRDDKTKTGADALRPEGIQAIKNVIANTFGNALSQNINPEKSNNENTIKYTEPRLKNRFDIPPFTTVKEVTENLAGYFEGGGANIFQDFPNATEADINRLEGYCWGAEGFDLTDAQVVELGNKILGYNKIDSNNNGTEGYKPTDEFRRVQEAVRGSSKKGQEVQSVFAGDLTSDQRQRLANVLGRQLGSIDSFIHGGSRDVTNAKHGTTFKIHPEVSPQLFHDIFEIVRYYTKNAELVDLHDDYSDCKCFLTEDGTAGFAVEPDGNLVSVFNLGTTKGFLNAIKDLVREAGATHLDAYASNKQNLEAMYEKTLGFHTASTMDYNMEYDHGDIAKNHGNPQVVFMVNHEVAEPKHFDKDSYDKAQKYQLEQLKTTQQKQQVDWARTSSNGYEVSTRGDRRFSALVATFKPGTIIDGVDVGGKTIEHVYQNVIKKSGKGKAPAKNSKLYNESLKTNEEREDFSYQEGYLPLWKEWAEQNPELMAELREKSQGKVLTDQFANTRVSQARALAEILNESEVKDNTQDTTVENPSIAEGKTMTVKLPNYEYFNDLYEDTSVDAEWKIPYLKELDAQLSNDSTPEEADNIINQMNKILQSTSEAEYKQELNNTQEEKVKKTLDDYDKINQQLNNLLDNEEGLTATDLRHVAQQIADELSDLITQVQSEKGLAAIQYPSVKTNIDFMTASRKEIVKAIGIDNMLFRAQKIFEVTDRDDSDVMAQAFLICDNWDALVSMASDAFAFNEGFGIRRDYSEGHYKVTDDSTVDYDNFSDYSNDADVNAEEGGKDEQEHWQIENRTIDVLNSMSALVRQGIHECYVLDADGNKVISKWGIAERVNPRNATNSILRWTQGSLSMDDMISKLSEKQKHNPWLSQLVERLSDKTGKETDFQSQFYGVFQKHFQPYSIVLLEDGKYHSIPVNSHPALTEAMNSISAQFKIGEHSLFTKTRINARDLGSKNTTGEKAASNLYKSLYEMQEVKKALKTGEELTSELADKFTRNVLAVCHILNYNITEDMISDITNEENVDSMTTALSFMVQNLTKAKEALASNKIKEYDPFKYYGDYNIRGELSKFLAPVTEKLEDVAISAFYDSGKMYQSYVTPSFMTKLMSKFKQPREDFEKFMMEEYGSSEWFKDKKEWRYRDGWKIEWLQKLATDDTMRQMFDHKVELNFNKHNYMRTMSDSEYALSLITEYYSENADLNADKAPSWYRVPMQSNKPSSEFIKFYSYRGDKDSYKKRITNGLQQMVNQELSRIQTVRMRNLSKGDNGFIKNFDTNGRKFCFFPILNSYLENTETAKAKRKWLPTEAENNRLAELLQMKVDGKEVDEGELKQLLHDAIRNSVEARVQDILEKWEKAGILEAAKNIKGIYPKDYDKFKKGEERDSYINPYVRDQVENFLWNDTFASKNILQLTLTDIAFYKDAEDLQKRLAQLHAPGIRGRIDAIDYNGKRVSDGRYRTLVLKDFDNFKSNIIANITEVFDRKIRNAKSEAQKKQLEALKDSLVRKPGTLSEKDKGGKYWNINVADAQGFSSPASYRKKALIFGKWSKHAEEIYQKLQKGEYNYTDLETAFQPLKPFVYSKLEKNMGVEGAPITTMHVPFQAKNAEYLLIMADALLKGEETSRPNLLRAIYRVMEDSEKLCPTKGIDTVQFESAIKSSLQGAMDIAQYREMEGGEEAAYTFMKNQIFKEEYNQKGERVYQNYNTDTFVHETSYEDYCLQQEVPEHFKEHSQAHGSQIRMITPSDLDFFTTDENGNQVDNYYEWTEPDPSNPGKTIQRRVKADEFRREYEQTIADNVKESIETLAKELCLTGENRSRKEQNIALAKILQREILSSPRYGIDLIQACSIDKETGEFRIPKGDPIQAKRIEQLINSIIKNRINKQKIAGGPIVQVSNFGTSKQLHIRFKDKKTNGLLPLEEEYNPAEHNGISYKDYCAKYQGGIAHFEVFMPIWSDELFKKFGKPDGTIDVEAIEALDPELLKMVSYRIPTEDKYSCAPMKVVGFMPREAGDAIMLPYELTEIDDSDFDVDKRYVMRKDIPIKTKRRSEIESELFAKASESYRKSHEGKTNNQWIGEQIKMFLDNPQKMKSADKFMYWLYKQYQQVAYYTETPTNGKTYRDNKIVDMTYAVLSNEMTADKILNPGGFDAPKKMGYMVAAYKNNSNVTWKELEGKSIDDLKDLCYTDKDLTYADTQVQFYKQNAAAASLIGVFAVNKVAHATLESNNIWLDVSEICGENPFYIAVDSYETKKDPKTEEVTLVVNGGTTLGGRMQIDKKYDSEGNLIGKTLGSLVSASADAVKDPILNLMNINMTTAGMLNTMLRLGMPFNDAALFLSQDIIGRTLNQFNKENLNNYKSLDEIIEGWLKAYRDKNGISEDSNINTEPLTKDELVEGITDKEHEATDYKVLLAFQKLRNLTDAMRNPTYITRFNSISSAVGPLIIDNLIMEHKLDAFNENAPKSGTHFYNAETEGTMINMYDIFAEHPLLEQFHRTVGMAKILFHDMPTGSTGFRNLMGKLNAEHSDIADKLYRDKKLFDQFANFYQSYLLIASGVINPNSLSNYVNGFTKWFMDQKYTEKYPENELIKAIKMNVTKASNRPFLTINTTGADEQAKEVLRSGWIDLHKADPVLSQRLFEYSFFRAGIGFSPKTFMSLVPTYVKERIKSKDGRSSYVDTYRNFPDVSMHFDRIIEQFIRNNWDNNKLAPYRNNKDTKYNIDVPHGKLTVWRKEDKVTVRGLSYIKTKGKGGTTNLWKKVSKESDSDIVFKLVKPLGNNGEYLEMYLNDITAPLSDTTKTTEDNAASAFEENDAVQDSTEETPTSPITDTEATKQVSELAKLMMKLNPNWTVEDANRNIEKIKSDDKQLWKSRKFLQNVFKQKGLELSEQEAMDKFKEMC